MAELDPVTQDFYANTEPYIAGIEAAIAATDRFRESVDAALISVEALHAAIDDLPLERTVHVNFETSGMPAAAAAAGAGLGGAGDAAGMHAEAAAADDAARATEVLAAATDAEKVSAVDAARSEYLLAMAERMRANTARDAAAAAADSGAAAATAARGWGILNRDVTLWGGALGSTALIGSVKLWHIALDGLFESAVALGEGLAALTVGIASMVPASQDIYNHLKAVQSVNSALGSSIPPLTGQFQDLARSMASQTVEAYGGALNLVNQNGTTLARVAHEVVTGLDDWIAKLDIWHHAQAGMGGMLQNGVGFLHQFEQVVNNVGQAINNLIRADPGTAHYLMDVVVGFSKLLDVVTSIPAPILMTVLALHSLDLWGGLAVSKIVQLGNALAPVGSKLTTAGLAVAAWGEGIVVAARNAEEGERATAALGAAFGGLGTKISGLLNGFMALAASPWAWAIAGAALIAVIAYQATQADHATKSFIADMNNGLANMTASQSITQIATDVGQLNGKLNVTSQALVAQMPTWHGFSGVVSVARTALNVLTGAFTDNVQRINADTKAYSGAIVNLTGEQKNLFNEMGGLVRQGYNYQQSLALMDMAGVKASDSLVLMRQKVDNLITGYQNLGVQGGMLGNAVNAVTFASELQNSKIQQLTQSYTTFLGVVTGGESAFVTAEQGLQGLATAATGMGAQMTVTNGKTNLQTKATGALGTAAASTATHIGGLSQSSLQLTNTWQTAITNGGNLVNSLLTQSAAAGMGAKGYNLVSGAAKDYLQQLLPMAKGNQLATADLYALAQVAGYQGAPSFEAISKWIGHTSNAAQDLQGKVTALTVASAGLTNDMNNLANAISGNLNQAMAAGIAQANGGQAAFNNYANAAVHAHGTTDGMTQAASGLARELIASTGDTNAAHRMFDTYSISLGLSRQQADALWASATRAGGAVAASGNDASSATGKMNGYAGSMWNGTHAAWAMAQAVNDIPNSKNVYVNVQEAITGTVGVGGILPTPSGHAAGWRVPGYGGGDVHPALLEGGEAIVPKELTPAVAPFLKSHGVPGFEGGGIMGSDGSYATLGGGRGAPQTIHVPVYIDGSKIAEAMVPYSAAAAGRYQVRNSGRATGQWGTGWKR
jgi:hypothetical protein